MEQLSESDKVLDDDGSESSDASSYYYEDELFLMAPKYNCDSIAPSLERIAREKKDATREHRISIVKAMLERYRVDNPEELIKLGIRNFDQSFRHIPHGEVSKRIFNDIQKIRPFDRYAKRLIGDEYTIAEHAALAKRKADGLEHQRLQVVVESRKRQHIPVFEFDKVYPLPDLMTQPWKIGIKEVPGAPVGFARDPGNVPKSEGHEVHFSYNGEWDEGMMNGQGVYLFSDGTRYEGFFKNNRPHEFGNTVYKSGASYEGSWKNGKYDGKGKLIFIDGSVYEGWFKAGKRHGTGKIVHQSGLSYEGDWKDGRPHGRGVAKSNLTKYKYEGSFYKGSIYGYGTLTFPSGRLLVRYWPAVEGQNLTLAGVVDLLQMESEDMAKKKKRDMEIVHGVNRSMLLEEYVAKVRIDLHSQRAREKRERIAAMMQMIKDKKAQVREAKLRALAGEETDAK